MTLKNNGKTVRWVGILVTIFLVIIGAVCTLSTKADAKLDKEKLDIVVFEVYKESQNLQFQSLENFQKSEFGHVQKSLGNIERRLGIYEPENPE